MLKINKLLIISNNNKRGFELQTSYSYEIALWSIELVFYVRGSYFKPSCGHWNFTSIIYFEHDTIKECLRLFEGSTFLSEKQFFFSILLV